MRHGSAQRLGAQSRDYSGTYARGERETARLVSCAACVVQEPASKVEAISLERVAGGNPARARARAAVKKRRSEQLASRNREQDV